MEEGKMPTDGNGRQGNGHNVSPIITKNGSQSNRLTFRDWFLGVERGAINPMEYDSTMFQDDRERAFVNAIKAACEAGQNIQDAIKRLESGPTYRDFIANIRNGGDTWQYFGIADALQERDPLEYLVNGPKTIFSLPSLNIVYGAPGDLKSFLLSDLAAAVAGGTAWLPPLPDGDGQPCTTHQAPVLWIDFDNGKRRCDERFGALARARNLPPDTPLYYVSFPEPWLDASLENALDDMTNRVQRLGVKLLIVDNLGQVTGDVEENSAGMARVMGAFRQLAERNKMAVILIHHQRKGGANGERAGDALRGHSSIEASLDLALHIHREPGAQVITISSTKTRDVDVHPFGAMFTYTHREGTKELHTARFFDAPIEDKTSDHAIKSAVLEVVESEPGINQTKLLDAVGEIVDAGRHRITSVITMLLLSKRLAFETGERNAKQYRILQ